MRARLLVGGVLATVLVGCSSIGGQQPAAGPGTAHLSAPASAASMTPSPSTRSTPASTPAPVARHLAPPTVPGLTWRPAGSTVAGVPVTYLAQTSGGQIGLLWMDASRLRFRYVPGYAIPEGSPVSPADNQPSTWLPHMVAAFNGGFMLSDHVGGYFYRGHSVAPLQNGLAAISINLAGQLQVGVWGSGLGWSPNTLVVRQNLRPLVKDFAAQAFPTDGPSAWGLANGGVLQANRSALGERSDGSLVFAYGSNLSAWRMAAALVAVHVQTAVMLDMNKSWPGGFVYQHVNGTLVGTRVLPSVWHQPSVYFQRYRKDFFVALAP